MVWIRIPNVGYENRVVLGILAAIPQESRKGRYRAMDMAAYWNRAERRHRRKRLAKVSKKRNRR